MQRTLRFAQHLPSFGWQPVVLSVSPRAYEATSDGKGNEIPEDLRVHRAFGLDTARHLSAFGRYPAALAIPDRWATWLLRAVPAALKLIREHHVDVIWSTFPIATAHKIGLAVARRSGLPWIAEFRDPMWQGSEYPSDPRTNRAWRGLEGQVFDRADRVVVTTSGARTEYAGRFPDLDIKKLVVLENGYDEETFQRAARGVNAASTDEPSDRPVTLLHSGIVYRSERDPTKFFEAVANLKSKGDVDATKLQIILRASGHEAEYRRSLTVLGIDDIVRLEPAIDYLSAIREMMSVDGLLVLQAANCNAQVPAKLYEYIRAGRPVLALTDPTGDTALTLRHAGIGRLARLDATNEIEQALISFLAEIRDQSWPRASSTTVARYARKTQTGELAALMGDLVAAER